MIHLARHLEQLAAPQSTALTRLLGDLTLAIKQISHDLSRAGLADLQGAAGSVSHQGEAQQKLDVLADQRIAAALIHSGQVCALASEEHEEPLPVPDDAARRAGYCVLYDPLDGSGNIDSGIPTGTIFAIYRRLTPLGERATVADLLQPGRAQVCAGYALYSSATQLVLALPGRVDGFTLDPWMGEFLRSHPDLAIPHRGKVYACNEGNAHHWDPGTQAFVSRHRVGRSARYSGALVADVHRILLQGGLFLYPADCADPAHPKPKLRLLYEGNPLGFVCRAAGGAASTGRTALLDVAPQALHQKVPLALGSAGDVSDYERELGAPA